MKIAIYPGSFNPWHEGHTDVLLKAAKVFKTIYVAIGTNPDKEMANESERVIQVERAIEKAVGKGIAYGTEVHLFRGLLSDYVKEMEPDAIIRGLRNSTDLEFEKTQQYWNEVLGIAIPTFYVITDRKLSHISSSAIRMVEKLKK
jgi:pantetheine-phosphate adenylyltransferase